MVSVLYSTPRRDGRIDRFADELSRSGCQPNESENPGNLPLQFLAGQTELLLKSDNDSVRTLAERDEIQFTPCIIIRAGSAESGVGRFILTRRPKNIVPISCTPRRQSMLHDASKPRSEAVGDALHAEPRRQSPQSELFGDGAFRVDNVPERFDGLRGRRGVKDIQGAQ